MVELHNADVDICASGHRHIEYVQVGTYSTHEHVERETCQYSHPLEPLAYATGDHCKIVRVMQGVYTTLL